MRELSTTHWVTVVFSSRWFTTRFRECQAEGRPYLSGEEASVKPVALPLQPTMKRRCGAKEMEGYGGTQCINQE